MTAWFNYNLVSVLVLSKHLATVGLLRIGQNWYTSRSIELKPWPPPAIFHTNITSEFVDTISVGNKLNVLDYVTLASSDLTELGYDNFHRYCVKKLVSTAMESHDKEKEMASVLLSFLYGNVVSSTKIRLGFVLLLEAVGDMPVDILGVVDVLGLFIARAVVDDILPPAFLSTAKVSISGSSKGMQVVQIAENSFNLSVPGFSRTF